MDHLRCFSRKGDIGPCVNTFFLTTVGIVAFAVVLADID